MSVFSFRQTKSEIEKLVEENDELKNNLHSVLQNQQSIANIEEKLKEAREELGSLNSKAALKKNELTALDEQIETLTRKLGETTEEKRELERRVDELKVLSEDSGRINELIETRASEMEKLNGEYQKLLALYKESSGEYERSLQNVQSLNQAEEKIRELIGRHGGSIEEALRRIEEVESETNERVARLKNEELKRRAVLQELEEKISLNEEIKNNLEASLTTIIGQLSEKEKIYTEYTNKREALIEEIHLKRKEYDEFGARYNFEKETIQRLREEVRELSGRKEDLLGDIRKFESLKNEMQDKILLLRDEEVPLSDELSRKQNAIDALEKHTFELEGTKLTAESNFSQILVKFTEELAVAKTRLDQLKQEIFEKEKELNTKEKLLLEKAFQIAEYSGLSKVLQKERSSNEQMNANMKEELKELTLELNGLKDEAGRHAVLAGKMRSETEILEAKKESLEKEIRQLIGEADRHYTSLNERKSLLLTEISESTARFNELKNQIASFKQELGSVKSETADAELKKEEYTAKVSELIALEKSLKFRISAYERQIKENKT